MRKYITTLCFIVLVFIVPFNQSLANENLLDATLDTFFTALQTGDIEMLKSCIGGVLYQEITKTTNQSKDYGVFLRQRYDGAIFSLTVKQQDENKMVARVNVDFQGQGTSVFELLVQKDSAGNWRIIDQYSGDRTL